jgi:hypothetical protein
MVTREELSKLINQSWLTVATKSINNLLFMKYYEIAFSNSVVLGDYPDLEENYFNSNMIALDIDMSESQIISTIKLALSNKERLIEMGNNVCDYFTERFEYKNGLAHFDSAISNTFVTTAHIINLEHRTDRHKKITNICNNLKTIHPKIFKALCGQPSWKFCGLSHLEIIKQNSNHNKNILVFEDDCNILNPSNFDERWHQIKKWLDNNPDKWDVFNGGPSYISDPPDMEILDADLNIIKTKRAQSTHFIYYNIKSIDKILKWDPDFLHPIDEFHIWANDLKLLTVYPYLATQYDSYSDINNTDVSYRKYYNRSQRTIEQFIKNKISV